MQKNTEISVNCSISWISLSKDQIENHSKDNRIQESQQDIWVEVFHVLYSSKEHKKINFALDFRAKESMIPTAKTYTANPSHGKKLVKGNLEVLPFNIFLWEW